MRKINKKKITILIFLIIIVILEIIAFRASSANKTIEITLTAIDNSGLLTEQNTSITAINTEKSGYYIILPEYINEKHIDKYTVKQKTIQIQEELVNDVIQSNDIINSNTIQTNDINSNTNSENNSNIISNNVINNSNSNNKNTIETEEIVEKSAGEKVYLTEEEVKNKTISITVKYDKIEKTQQNYYYKKIEEKINDNLIKIEGYMPLDAKIKVTEPIEEVVEKIIQEYENDKVSLQVAYDIKIVTDEKEYEPIEIDKDVKVSITGIEKLSDEAQKYKVVHVKEEKIEEINEVQSKKDEVIFQTDSFSTYAVLLDNTEVVDSEAALFAVGNAILNDASIWDKSIANSFKFGNGTQSNPYFITKASELAYLAQQVNNGNTYENNYFQLIRDIDLNGEQWTPIGTTQNSFRGIFDGTGHIISNADISLSKTLPTENVESYGIFGSIGGSDNTDSVVKNVEISNINIYLTANGNTNTDSTIKGYHIGIVTGSIYQRAKITNVIVKNSTITDTNTINIRGNSFQLSVGGIAGYATRNSNNTSDPGNGKRYAIENCFSNVNIDLDVARRGIDYTGQYHAGGIIGTIRSQPVWPSNCLYVGHIDATYGFTGPMFGALINWTDYTSRYTYSTLWNGNDAGNLTLNNGYYNNYSTNSTSFTSSITNGTSNYNKSTNISNIGQVQGVNKGSYMSNISQMLSTFNSNSNGEVTWKYENGTYSFVPKFSITLQNNAPTYSVNIKNSNNAGPYTYKWYVNDIEDTTLTSNSITKEADYINDYEILVLVSNGTNYAVSEIIIPKLSLYFEFNINNNTNTVVATLAGTALPYINISDYTYQWYKEDISGDEIEKLEGQTSLTLNNLLQSQDYKIIATNNKIPELTIENSFLYGNRQVIYVDYQTGNDNNDGLTKETAVRTITEAYTHFSTTGQMSSNVAIIIGEYNNNDYISQNNTTYQNRFSKPATITGKYKGTDYDARMYFGVSDNNVGRVLYADTCIQNMTLYGSTNSSGNGITYMYLQGHSLTMGNELYFERYKDTKNTNALVDNCAAPDFHIIGGFSNYNGNNLSSNNNNGIITIKSGTYARIITGSRNTKVNGTSHNFTGTKSNPFNMKINIDIKKSTTSSKYKYDVNLLVGGQTDGNVYANVELKINSGRIGRILGGSIGYSRTVSNYPSNSFFGSTKIDIIGGEIDEVFGGSLGRLQSDVYYYGAIEINISGGTINNTLYGVGAGGVTGYDSSSTDQYKSYGQDYDTKSTINITGGSINGNIYGAGYGYSQYLNNSQIATDGGAFYGDSYINITGGNIDGNIYGAGRGYSGYSGKTALAQMKGTTNITISGSPEINGDIYGAGEGIANYSETAKFIGTTNIYINTDLSQKVYGGGNISKTEGTTNVYINSGTHTNDIYGGGNVGEVNGTAKVYIKGGKSATVYTGGQSSNANTTYSYLQGGEVDTLYGGSNVTGTIQNSNIEASSGIAKIIYGGNNVGGNCNYSNVQIKGATITTAVYGGGNQIATNSANIVLNSSANDIPTVYGGGNQAGVQNTYIYAQGANVETIFGGSNIEGTVDNSNVYIYAGTINNVYGGNNQGGTTIKSNISSSWGTVTNSIYGGGNQANTTESHIVLNGFANKPNSVYGGGHSADVTTSYIDMNGANVQNVYGGSNIQGNVQTSNITVSNGTIDNVYGGNNQGGITNNSNVTISGGTINNVFGGNNQGGTTNNSHVYINSGNVTDVYGGGDKATTNETHVEVNGKVLKNVYGGGNEAGVNTNTYINLNNATIEDNVYGGGNEGTVNQDTYVNVKNSICNNSIYAGGNGTTAIVYGNTNLIMQGTTNSVKNSVFGGGNKAITGNENNHDSISSINIVGGTIGKNVYGGANTSIVYGVTKTNIGYNAVGDNSLEKGNIQISGTVFGGGEANEAGSENYDFSFISVTDGTTINIDANSHDKFLISGSIFGSGNASSTSGTSYINIKNYGTIENPNKNVSIQRANITTIDNSNIAISGAKDRTNEYSSTYFTISRVDEIKLKNNSTLYLNCGANLLKKFSSLVDINGQEQKAQITINEETNEVSKNVDNRLYMAEGKNINIATNEQVTAYGEVYGMTFFGLFTNTMNAHTSTGIYNQNYNNGDNIVNAGTFTSNSYVMAQHLTNHNTSIDGFYTNENEDGKIKTKYVETTPKDDVYYVWLVGEKMDVTTFEISLTASKYATLGTYELLLTGFSTPNIKFVLNGFSAGLSSDISLINSSDIPSIASTEEEANRIYGLTMKSGNNGWQNKNTTNFLTENGGTYTGSNLYTSDNSTFTPTLNFCLYHSENLTTEGKLGDVKVRFQAMTPIDDLNYSISYIDINIALLTALYQNDFYEAAITPGKEFDLFTTTETNISDKSAFSTYYSLYIDEFSKSDYKDEYSSYKRVLASRDSNNMPYVLPENTKITMLDMVTKKYYYYVITNQDVNNGKYLYTLSDFIYMGSNNKYFNEQEASQIYYDTDKDLIYENYIFHIDFAEANVTNDILDNNVLMELRDTENQILVGVLGIQRDTMKYSVYNNQDAKIDVNAVVTPNTLYLGDKFELSVTTDFVQTITNSKTIYDTEYFDKKMGIKISVYDSNGNRLNSDSLLGIAFELDGQKYYPRIDGTTRICIADKISNVLSRLKIDTKNNKNLATDTYTIRIESFGSYDGIYYGLEASDMAEVKIYIINSFYGLKVSTEDNLKIVDDKTGNTQKGNNYYTTQIEYSSGLAHPNIAMSLYRREYGSDIYSQDYNLVDLKDYVTNTLTNTNNEKEYLVSDNPIHTSFNYLNFKENLVTGTYKLVFKLYDGNNFIGEAYEYFIIK